MWQKWMKGMAWGEGGVEYFWISKLEKQMFRLRAQCFLCSIKCGAVPDKLLLCVKAAPVPHADLLMPQGEHLVHGRNSRTSKTFIVLAHFDGLQPLRHRLEHSAVTATGTRQADRHSARDNIFRIIFIGTFFFWQFCVFDVDQTGLNLTMDLPRIDQSQQ